VEVMCWHYSYNQQPICTTLGKMTDANKIMHPQHFGTDPTDIQIQINLKIRMQISDHFHMKFWRWGRFALSECSCYYYYYYYYYC